MDFDTFHSIFSMTACWEFLGAIEQDKCKNIGARGPQTVVNGSKNSNKLYL